MNKTWATVNKIIPFSCVDGPGNRLVIFLQGCNFNCLNCHNPYTIRQCQHCGDCVSTCPHSALRIEQGKTHWQADQCQSCDTCITRCLHQSTPMTYSYNVSQLISTIRTYLPFLNGITFSGGEATLQLGFIQAVFSAIKQAPDLHHLTCFIDSNGYLSQHGWQKVLPVTDGVMVDLKAWDNKVHQKLTGRDNLRVKDSIRYLAEKERLFEVRLLLIPNQTDLMQKVQHIAEFLLSASPNVRVRINAFHRHGVKGEAANWSSATQDDVEQLADALIKAGIPNVTKPVVYLTT